jgi:hypothetical protein
VLAGVNLIRTRPLPRPRVGSISVWPPADNLVEALFVLRDVNDQAPTDELIEGRGASDRKRLVALCFELPIHRNAGKAKQFACSQVANAQSEAHVQPLASVILHLEFDEFARAWWVVTPTRDLDDMLARFRDPLRAGRHVGAGDQMPSAMRSEVVMILAGMAVNCFQEVA